MSLLSQTRRVVAVAKRVSADVAQFEADLDRLARRLASLGAIDPELDPIGAAIQIIDAYHEEHGPWPGQVVPVKEER